MSRRLGKTRKARRKNWIMYRQNWKLIKVSSVRRATSRMTTKGTLPKWKGSELDRFLENSVCASSNCDVTSNQEKAAST